MNYICNKIVELMMYKKISFLCCPFSCRAVLTPFISRHSHLDLLITQFIKHSFGYNTDHSLTPNGHFILPLIYVCIFYYFYARYNTNWIANKEIGLNPSNSVIKRLWCLNNVVLTKEAHMKIT